MQQRELIDEVLTAHGGWERWNRVRRIEARLSSGGFAFTTHMQPHILRNLRISVKPHEAAVTLLGFGGEDYVGRWTPSRVQLWDSERALVAERHNPRESFNKLVKNVRWDKLDMLYFAGYALWNYLSFPFILDSSFVTLSESHALADKGLDTLSANFAPWLATHSMKQAFHVNAQRHLVRHDYTADVIGSWANATNYCVASEVVSGLRFYTRRKVFPRFGARIVMPFPTLVWIELDDIEVRDGL